MFTEDFGGQWAVILDNSEYKDDYWMVQVNADHALVIMLESEGQPLVVPRPPLKSVDLCMPFLKTSTSKSEKSVAMKSMMLKQLERNVLNNFSEEIPASKKKQIEKMEIKIDKEILGMVYECVKNNQLSKALDASQRLIGAKSISMAKKIANDHSLVSLSDRITNESTSFSLRSFNQNTQVETAFFKEPSQQSQDSFFKVTQETQEEKVEDAPKESEELEVNLEELSNSIDQSKVTVVKMGEKEKPKKSKKRSFESFTPNKGVEQNFVEKLDGITENENDSKKRKRAKENSNPNPPKKTKLKEVEEETTPIPTFVAKESEEIKKTTKAPIIPVGKKKEQAPVAAKKQQTLNFSKKLSSKTAEILETVSKNKLDEEEEFDEIEIKM
jgi:hypothetical protein